MEKPVDIASTEDAVNAGPVSDLKTRGIAAGGKWFVMGVFVLVAGLAAGLQAFRAGGVAEATQEGAAGPARPTEVREFCGMTLQLHSAYSGNSYEKVIDEIVASAKVNTLALSVAAYQENCSSTSIFIDIRRVPPDDQLKKIIAYAHGKGLHVTLMPIVLLENARESEWRGKIRPEGGKWDDWWEDYTNYIMHYVYIAQETKVDLFMVGSELISTEDQTDRWKKLIKQVRGSYSGRLSYSANWDHYNVPRFWNDLDVVGMTTYYDLCGDKKPTEEVLVASWKKIRKNVMEWRKNAKVNRPLLFTEVGWPNQETAARYAWDYYRAQDKPDPELQARCFKTFFDTWADEKAVAGFLVWEWRTNLDQQTAPTKDTGYVPKDKPAMKIINDFFAACRAAGAKVARTPASAPAENGSTTKTARK